MKHDWDAIKREYITTTISTPTLADKYGVSYRTIAHKCTNEKWVDLRADYLRKKDIKVVERTMSKVATVESDKLIKAINIVDGFADQLQQMMSDKDQFKRALTRNTDGELVDTITNKYDTKAMKEASEAIKNLVELTRNVHNLPLMQEEQKSNSIEVVFKSNDLDDYSN